MKSKLIIILSAVILFLIPNMSFGQVAIPPNLGTTSTFALFTAGGAFTVTGAAVVKGDVGTNAGAFAAFPPGSITGNIRLPGSTEATNAATDVGTAYSDLTQTGAVLNVVLDGLTITPGVYATGAAATLGAGQVFTLNGLGDPNSKFLIRINGGALALGVNAKIILINSASPNNVYWQISGATTIAGGSEFRGNIISSGAINLLGSASLTGRGLTTAGLISADANSVTLGAPPAAPVSTVNQPTCAVATGTITVTSPTGAGMTYSIDGLTYQASVTFAGLTPGSYNVTAMNADGYVSTPTIEAINIPPTAPVAPTASTTIQPTCGLATGTVVVTAPIGAGYEYNIDGGVYQSSVTFSGISAGSHPVLVRRTPDNTCISGPTSVIVNAQPAPPAGATTLVTQPTCSVTTGTIVVTAPLGATYEYNLDGGVYQASVTFSGVASGSHNVLVRSTLDPACISPVAAVTVNAAPVPPAGATTLVTQPTCAVTTGTIVVTAPLGVTYEYNLDGGVYQASVTFSGVASGSHNILVRSTLDPTCISPVAAVTVNAAPVPPVGATTLVTQPTCAVTTGTIVVTAPLGATYEYNLDGGVYQASVTFSGVASGSHNVLVRSTLDPACISPTAAITVNAQPANPAVPTASATLQPTCLVANGTITLTAPTGLGMTYSIDGSTYTNTTGVFTTVIPGTYNVTAKSSDGCISTGKSVTINAQPVTPAPTVLLTQPDCTIPLGTITVTAPTGAGMTYSIDGTNYTNTSGIFTLLPAGTYTVTAKNADGCISKK